MLRLVRGSCRRLRLAAGIERSMDPSWSLRGSCRKLLLSAGLFNLELSMATSFLSVDNQRIINGPSTLIETVITQKGSWRPAHSIRRG